MTEDISDTESEDEAERADATTQVSESLMTEDISDTESEDGDLVASSTAATSTTDSLDVDMGEVDIDREVQECLRASMAPIQDRPPTPWPSTNVSDVDEDEDYRRMTLKMELDGAFEGLDDWLFLIMKSIDWNCYEKCCMYIYIFKCLSLEDDDR